MPTISSTPASSSVKATKARDAPDGEDDDASARQHVVLRELEGYCVSRQQCWCCVCNAGKVSYTCAYSSSADTVFAIHPLKKDSGNTAVTHAFVYDHRSDPGAHKSVPVSRRHYFGARESSGATSSSAYSTPTAVGRHARLRPADDVDYINSCRLVVVHCSLVDYADFRM